MVRLKNGSWWTKAKSCIQFPNLYGRDAFYTRLVGKGNEQFRKKSIGERTDFFDSNNMNIEDTHISVSTHYNLENDFSTQTVKVRKATYERQRIESIITSIVCIEMYGLKKKTIEIVALCQTFSWANAPSYKPKDSTNLKKPITDCLFAEPEIIIWEKQWQWM